VLKFTEISVSCPVTGPLPPVKTLGSGCMPPGLTLLFAVKLDCRTIGTKPGDPAENWRSSNATSEGELTLVGTFCVENVGGPLVRPTLESAGKTRYTSTTTFFISLVDLYIACGRSQRDQAGEGRPRD
jgi:hypothetical protein